MIGIEAAPKTPNDPRLSMADAYSSKISDLIFNGLFRINERMEVIPDLVKSYQLIQPTLYRFHLKSGVVFHDGRPLTANDVKKTIEAILDPTLASPHRSLLSKIEAIHVLNDLSLEIKLAEPFAPLPDALRLGILPDGKDIGIGTGPYKIEKFIPAEGITLTRNENYFGEKPRMARLHFKVIPDDNVRVLELLSGQVDFLQNNIPYLMVDYLRKKPALQVAVTNGVNFTYLGMNLNQEPLNKQEVREAIAHAIDVPSIIRYRFGDLATPATGILPPIHWAYEGNVKKYPYNPPLARKLLDQAGYRDPDGVGPKSRFSFTYKTSTNRERIGLARLIARYLKEVGIGVHILPFEWGTFFHDIQTGNFQLYSLTWVRITEPDIYHYIFHSSQTPPNGANRGSYKNESIDRLTTEARKTLDLPKRHELYSYTQKVIAQEIPYINLWYEKNVAVFQKNLRGVRLRPDAGFEIFTEVYKE